MIRKKRILWICNIMPLVIAKKEKVEKNVYGGWISGMLNGLLKSKEYDLGVGFPNENKVKGTVDGLYYQSFQLDSKFSRCYQKSVENQIRDIIDEFNPDILHIFGTEYIHSLAAINAFNNHEKTVINIQGLVSICSEHYCLGIPEKVRRGYTLADMFLKRAPKYSQRDFKRRGGYERLAIKKAGHIIGRTDWDRACVQRINPCVKYHFCNETLRDVFYELPKWNYEKCRKHTIFMGQASYPVKGFHFAIEAIYELKKSFSDLKVFIAGTDIRNITWKKRLLMDSYTDYLLKKIKKYNLENTIEFTGDLSAEAMRKQYLRCNVFLLTSTIENSPNSICEAMLLGVPVVSSDVGGVKNFIIHEDNGYIYPCDEPYMAVYYIKKIFNDEKSAQKMGQRASDSMELIVDRKHNAEELKKIYDEIMMK